MTGRRWWAVGLLVALLVAGVGSYYASTHPDGLEHVAGTLGFDDSGRSSATSDSPLADYETTGVSDARVSGGLAGVIGTVVVLGLGGGLFWLVRSRPGRED